MPLGLADAYVFVISAISMDLHRNPHYQPKYKCEFWIDRVIPIFQALGDHSQLLGFQWREVPSEEHMVFTLDSCTWKHNAANKYHDGMGYDDNNRNRLVMEGSSSALNPENAGLYIHTQVQFVDIPIKYNNRASWASVFELLAYLLFSLREQEMILDTVNNENVGLIHVIDTDRDSSILQVKNNDDLLEKKIHIG
ncbi:unnamed protein product [Rhizopus stolonifer]